jgi:hypothetical protein
MGRVNANRVRAIAMALAMLLPLLVLAHPRGRATLRITPGFLALPENPRVYYEHGSEQYARRIAMALPAVLGRVTKHHKRAFRPGFRIYVTATHRSFSRHIGHRPDTPVRGMAMHRDVWISPLAFAFHGRDTHVASLTHELSHLHLGQHLSWVRRVGTVPTWFSEGLADWVAKTGDEVVTKAQARKALVYGPRMFPDDSGRLPWPRAASDYGLSWPMFHLQARLFVEYLHSLDSRALDGLVAAVLDGRRFDQAFRDSFGQGVDGLWHDFLEFQKRLLSEGERGQTPAEPWNSVAAWSAGPVGATRLPVRRNHS